jgi:sugar phosphate isomerase/epimerase
MSTAVKVNYENIWAQAQDAGYKAVADLEARAGIVPIIVGEPTTPFGSDIDYSKPTYIINDGVCGFAQIRFAGNTAFGRWAKANELANKIGFKDGFGLSGHRVFICCSSC